ncbi:MAG: type II toxin-antitoxin system PemK/MazF family toxin [Thermomicrobiales bacterium]
MRGEVWLAMLDPVVENEQGGIRPVVIVSRDSLNQGGAGLVIAVPMTTRERGLAFHVPVTPPDGGLRRRSFAKCEDIRSLSVTRLIERWGDISPDTMLVLDDRLRMILNLPTNRGVGL